MEIFLLTKNEENRAKFFTPTPSFSENLKEKNILKRNLLEKNEKSYCQNATALSSALACPETWACASYTPARKPARPLGVRSGPFFVRSALKKMRTDT